MKPAEYPDIPSLEFVGFSKNTLNQSDIGGDTLLMTLKFTDGDGDFGTEDRKTEPNIFVKDLRTNQTLRQYKAPFIPLEGTKNGVSGKINIVFLTTCCVFPPATGITPCSKVPQYPKNDLSMEIYIKDRAGNSSNIVTTPPITLNCN
ncbi:MAG: hypothetical protein IPK35_13075 [Saprospiraceae bacterium]|nr:hypothetical protein [Saprospiraceae bacterium]